MKKDNINPKMIAKWTLFLLCLLWLGRTIQKLGLSDVWAVIQEADLGMFLLSLIPLNLFYLLWTWKWQLMAKERQPMGYWFIFRLIMAGGFINFATPTAKLGGGFFRAFAMKHRYKLNFAEAYGWVFLDQVTGLLGKVLLFGCLSTVLLVLNLLPEQKVALWVIGPGCLLTAMSWPLMIRFLKHGSGWLVQLLQAKMKKGIAENSNQWVEDFLKPVTHPVPWYKMIFRDLGLSGLGFFGFCISNAMVLKAMGSDASIIMIGVIVMIGYFSGSFLGVMGGLGVTEVILIKLYQEVGIPGETAAAATLAHRGILYLWVLSIGGWSTWHERPKQKQKDGKTKNK